MRRASRRIGRILLIVAAAVLTAGALGGDRPAAAPRFMLTSEVVDGFQASRLTVREVATGRVTQEVARPYGVRVIEALTSAADNRTFYFSGGEGDPDLGHLFRLRINDRGRIVAVTPVPGIRPYGPALALSADGRRLAFAHITESLSEAGQIVVADLTNGRRQRWLRPSLAAAGDLSWSADGRKLAFDWQSMGGPVPNEDGTRVLDTARTGDPIALSRLVVPAERPGATEAAYGYRMISADGTGLQVIARSGADFLVSQLSVETGRPVRDLHRGRGRLEGVCRTPTGRHLLLFEERAVTVLDTVTGDTVVHRYAFPERTDGTAC